MPERGMIALSEQFDRLKRRAADTDCKLPQKDSKEFRDQLYWLLNKIEDTVKHVRDKNGII